MNNATTIDLLEEFNELFNLKTDEQSEKVIARLYLGMRLKKIIGKYSIQKHTCNFICKTLFEYYEKENYSLDKMIDAVYNFININYNAPTAHVLSDIIGFLEDYSEE